MRTPGKKLFVYKSRKHFVNEEISKTISMPVKQNGFRVANTRRGCLARGISNERVCKRNNTFNGKPVETLQWKFGCNLDKRIGSLRVARKRSCFSVNMAANSEKKTIRRRKLKGKRKNALQDEASRMQRRARYFLIKMKMEQNLIDAYSGDGWKGQSREKIKPVKELQRAHRQILKCKLGIRDSIHQLELLGFEGRIEDSVMHPDGSVFHEHIFCAKCKLHEALPDNDIILCDGNCSCGFHQKCLEPPLEKIPPGDQGWLCKICSSKMEILEAINAHLGTCFTVNSKWEDMFKEAIASPDSEEVCPNLVDVWPSDDSKDEDYLPDSSKEAIEENILDNACSSVDSILSSDASYNFVSCMDSNDSGDEIINYRRQRRFVDYKKLYDEMFGNELNEGEERSEDEDWGPFRKKKIKIAFDIGSTSTYAKDKDIQKEMVLRDTISCSKRPFLRIPPDTLKAEAAIQPHNTCHASEVNERHRRTSDEPAVSLDSYCLLPLASIFSLPRHKKGTRRSEKLNSAAASAVKKQKKVATTVRSFETLMQMLWVLERRLYHLKQQLQACSDDVNKEAVIYVPVAEVKEKMAS